MARLTEPYEFNVSIQDKGDFNTLMEERENELQQLREEAPDNSEEGIVGAVISFGVADGYAVYRVTKEDPLTLQHIPIRGGDYTIPDAHVRGLRRQDVIDKVDEKGSF